MKNLARWMVCGALLTAACVEQPRRAGSGSGPSSREVEAVRSRVVSNTAPNPAHRLNINFDNKVTLLGYDIIPDTTSMRPGSRFTVKWYWKCEQPVGDGWKLFTHFADATTSRENHDNDGADVRRVYQPERWRRGEYITDVQEFTVSEGWNQPILRIYTGLWKGDERMPVRSTGHQMSEGRALAIELQIGVTPTEQPSTNPAPTAQQPSNLSVPRAGVPPNIDGRLDDAVWRTAASTGALVNTLTGQPAGPEDAHANVRVLWDDRFLYLGWEVQDDHLVETGTARDAHYWENDAVEVLIDPDGDGTNYYEIQVSPGGHTFDSQQPQPPSGSNFGRTEWNPNLRVAVTRQGTLGNPADQDTGYTVEMAIPWSAINAGAAHTPPQVGDTWRMNFFVMDRTKQGTQRAAGWSAPLAGSFHTTARFGHITFAAAGAVQPGIVPILGPAAVPTAQAQPTTQPSQPEPSAQQSANDAQPQGTVAIPRDPTQITPAMLNQLRRQALQQRQQASTN